VSYNSRSNRFRHLKAASPFALVQFLTLLPEGNCTPLGPFTITNWVAESEEIRYVYSTNTLLNTLRIRGLNSFCCLLCWGNCSEIRRRWFEIVAKLSACQISGIRGGEFGKLYIKVVLLAQGYLGEKIRFSILGFSVKMFCASANPLIKNLWTR